MSANKGKLKKKFTISIFLYLAIIVSLTVYTFAWFVSNYNVEVGVKDDVIITSSNKLEIMNLDAETPIWGNKIELDVEKDSVCPDITGDGMDFYYPQYLIAGDKPDMDDARSYQKITSTTASQFLVTLRIKFRSANAISVYLGQDSFVTPKNTATTGEGSRRSAFGEFSVDYIAGCARVAFVELQNGVETLKSVWIPNDKYELSYQGDTDNADFKSDGTREDSYGYHTVENNTVVAKSYGVNDYANGFVSVGNSNLASKQVSSGNVAVNNAYPLLTFDGESVEEKELIIRIWFEGTDREADKALAGGQVAYNFDFLGVAKEDASVEDVAKLNTLNCKQDGYLYFGDETEIAKEFLYSTNGIDWATYNGEGGIRFLETCTIYVKTLETISAKPSEAIKLDIIKS